MSVKAERDSLKTELEEKEEELRKEKLNSERERAKRLASASKNDVIKEQKTAAIEARETAEVGTLMRRRAPHPHLVCVQINKIKADLQAQKAALHKRELLLDDRDKDLAEKESLIRTRQAENDAAARTNKLVRQSLQNQLDKIKKANLVTVSREQSARALCAI